MARSWWTVLQLLASLFWRQLRRDLVTYNVDLAACQRRTFEEVWREDVADGSWQVLLDG